MPRTTLKSLFTAAGVVLLSSAAMQAQTAFNVTGGAFAGATFSGTMTIDTVAGTVTAVNIAVTGGTVTSCIVPPGPAFQFPAGSPGYIIEMNCAPVAGPLRLVLRTPLSAAGSLVGYAGGAINTDTIPQVFSFFAANTNPVTAGTLTAATPPQPPTVTKVITADTLVVGGASTTMTITLTNPNAFPLSGVALSDTFPGGLTPSAVGGTCLPSPTLVGQTVSVSGVTLAAAPGPGNQCTISATVTASGAVWGTLTNTTGAVTSSDPATTGLTASDSVLVLQPPTMTKAFAPATIAISGTSVITFSIRNLNAGLPMTDIHFTDSLPAGLIVSQSPNVSNTCGGVVTAASNATSISLTGGALANGPAATCQISVTVQGTTPGPKVNTTDNVFGTVSTVAMQGNQATATLVVNPSEVSFLMRYASNLNIGESVVNFTNTGESSTFSFGTTFAQNGEICANVFAYSPDEQLVSCCSCNVTPNGLNSLSVKADLGTNTLTPIIPSSLVIKVVATQGGTACSASSASTVNTAVLQPGLAAWGTTLHALPVDGGNTAGTYGVSETPFSLGTITPAELQRMAQLCSFIRANGSGYGICKSCKVGGLGASSK